MKKTLLLFSLTLLSFASLNAQTVGDTFTEGDISYIVTVVGPPNQVAVTGTSLTSLVIPSSVTDTAGATGSYIVTSIDNGANSINGALTDVEIPETVVSIVSGFRQCNNLTTVSFTTTNNIASIGTKAFEDNYVLTDASLDAVLSGPIETIGGYAFYRCYLLENLIAPSTLTTLDSGVFRGITSLETADFSNTTLTDFTEYTVQDSPLLTTVTLPSTLTSIGDSAFRGCPALTTIICAAAAPPVMNAAAFFGASVAGITAAVPDVSIVDYQGAALWQDMTVVGISTLSTENLELELGLSMYPNPTEGVVSIRNSKSLNAEVTVYDLNGRSLMSKSVSNTLTEINISNLASGIYLFKVKADNSEFVKRIVKQ